jgi:hypothetical protein
VKQLSPYRSLPAEKRQALVLHEMQRAPAQRELFVRRIASRPGGFRLETVRKRPTEQLAREIVKFALENAAEEVAMLQTLYLELEPELQIEFLDACGVKRDGVAIHDDVKPPFADAATVRTAAIALVERHGESARHYLRTIATYNADGWPGLGDVLAGLPAA